MMLCGTTSTGIMLCRSFTMLPGCALRVCASNYRHLSTWQVSSLGRVRSSIGSVTYGSRTPAGYRVCSIQGKTHRVHRLVAAAFLGPAPTEDHAQVNHKDGDPSNNRVQNLEYVTPSQNLQHSWMNGRSSNSVTLGIPVHWRPCGEEHWRHSCSQTAVAKTLGLSQASVWMCCKGKSQKARAGETWYEFKFADHLEDSHLLDAEVWKAAVCPFKMLLLSGVEVSTCGRVRFCLHGRTRITNGCRSRSGYSSVAIGGRTLSVHRLVLATFCGQPGSPGMHVNHKDGNPGNNHVENLEYVTPSQNAQHSYDRGRRGVSGTRKPVYARHAGFDADTEWQIFPSMKAAALRTGVRANIISKLCRGQLASHPTWQFRFVAEKHLPGEEWRPVMLDSA